MKRKIISFIGITLFIGVLVFNINLVEKKINGNKLDLKIIEASAISVACYWYADNLGYGSVRFTDCYGCVINYGDNLRYPDTCQ